MELVLARTGSLRPQHHLFPEHMNARVYERRGCVNAIWRVEAYEADAGVCAH
jgi:hypothetical protein